MTARPCPGGLNIRGEHFACDWPTDEAGQHQGWAHSNSEAGAIWANLPEDDGNRVARWPDHWSPKTLRERLCQQETHCPDPFTRAEMGRLIAVLDLHRPIGRGGKHGDLHTPTCGCEGHR